MNTEKSINEEIGNAVLPLVVGSASDIQYCKDCVNYPCDSYEKSAKCRLCSWNGKQQTKFERRSF